MEKKQTIRDLEDNEGDHVQATCTEVIGERLTRSSMVHDWGCVCCLHGKVQAEANEKLEWKLMRRMGSTLVSGGSAKEFGSRR